MERVAEWSAFVFYEKFSNEFQTFYAHMESINVTSGDMISQYDVIGKVGSTGRSTGPHLHLSVYINENKVDPMKLFEGVAG